MKRRIICSSLFVLLSINLFFGAQVYLSSAHASQKDDPYENYKLLADVLEKVRMEYVDGEKLTYQDLIHGALKGMLSTLDPHSEFMDPLKYDELKHDTSGEFGGVGIVVQQTKDKYLTVIAPMEDTPSYRAGIQPLDRIIKIDGRATEKFTLDDAVKHLRGEPGTEVTVTIQRPANNEIKDYKLVRASIKVDTVKDLNGKREFTLGENKIGYIHLTQFGEKTGSDLEKALKKLNDQGMKALILDLRGNPGGLLEQAQRVCEQFLPAGQLIVTTEGRDPSQNSVYRATRHKARIDMPIVVLVNIGSASAAEIVAGCLQDLQSVSHAVILGEQTFGKGSVQSILPLADGSALRLTTAKYYTPSHKVIHEHGITPDIVVPMSDELERDIYYQKTPGSMENLEEKDRERIKNAHDVQMERATDLLKGMLIYSDRSTTGNKVASAKKKE